MQDFEIDLPSSVDPDAVMRAVENVCAKEALDATLKTTLKKYPGCVHWHFKRHNERGVLEVTWWAREEVAKPSRLWLSIHGNRQADWILELMPRLGKLIEAEISA